MNIKFLNTPWQRSIGAMFRKNLEDTALVFEYPHAAPRIFHTAFCRPLHILAFSDEGIVVFDRVIQPWRLVQIPTARIVVELDPAVVIDEQSLWESVRPRDGVPQTGVGSWHPEVGLDRLFFALIAEAVADIRRVYEAISRAKTLPPDLLPINFSPWERGQILGSAVLLLVGQDYMDIPENAVLISRQVIAAEKQTGHIADLLAASSAGYPWYFPRVCFKCEARANWRPVFSRPAGMPNEIAWRYERPENQVPICRRCVYVLKWKMGSVRRELAKMLWGARFDAFSDWHENWKLYRGMESWDLERYPLWPTPCGGETWAEGSGAIEHTSPQEPKGVHRGSEHLLLLDKYFQRKAPTRRFWTSPNPKPVALEAAYSAQGVAL